ncbi:MAG: glycosyltransferase, partial [Solirubrobacterales bacterium]|nr:glycosyltransferase [Solirubrobacterales bacterium]
MRAITGSRMHGRNRTQAVPSRTSQRAVARPTVRGKFLWLGDRKLDVRGVTYGTFEPGADGVDYPPPERVQEDLAGMAAAGFNTLRTYTPPPRWLLDSALRHGLVVMVGLPWEQHIDFLDDRGRAADIERRVREAVRSCAGHPAILAWTIGNEIPASIVRWHGRERVERFLLRLYRAVQEEDPGGLVTYVNFPTTEYLDLPFLDLCAFNVYLEDEERLEAYLARLQVVAGDRPLLMAEIGLDSRSNGEDAQSESLRWQLRTALRCGCAGALVFAWTDEWYRGGHAIEDWDFGLVRRDRTPKPALAVVRETLAALPPAPAREWPRMSVVVCSYNGARTLDECLTALGDVDYPDFEVIVVDDGSSDATPQIARAHRTRLISTPNRGLSSARNTAAGAATGEIVCYLDDDAAPDPHWLRYLAISFVDSDHVAVGGPNIPLPDDGPVASCVASAPGNPIHVLLSDTEAEHIPGCNMAIRRDALLAIGGFDEQFRIAGDDVDMCWRLQQAGGTIGFSHAAMVWHHRRASVGAFWRQQRNYGRAEAMLERKWPDKYNAAGHVSWQGRVYSAAGRRTLLERSHVYYGTWGSGLFQRLYCSGQPQLAQLPLMPEFFLAIGLLSLVTAFAALWPPLLLAAPLLVVAVAAVVGEAWARA